MIKRLFALGLLAMTVSGAFGCAYGGIAAAPDGTVYVARNDYLLFGLLRKVYVCKPVGPTLACTEVPAAP